jgi:hypothetical protein
VFLRAEMSDVGVVVADGFDVVPDATRRAIADVLVKVTRGPRKRASDLRPERAAHAIAGDVALGRRQSSCARAVVGGCSQTLPRHIGHRAGAIRTKTP